MNRRIYIICFLLVSLSFASCSKFNRIQKSDDNQKILSYANELYQKEKYNKAQQLYDRVKNSFKATKEYEQIFYNYVYTFYYMKDYTSAAFYFKNFVQVFPKSDRLEEMSYMEAYCFYKLSPRSELDQTDTKKAISAMQTFINIYPSSDRVGKATDIIDNLRKKLEKKEFTNARLYYDLEYYNAAGVTFNNLLLDYPESNSGDKYKFMAIKSYFKYADNSVITKQKERYQEVVSQFLTFEEFYPNSSFTKEAQSYYNSAKEHIHRIEKLVKERKDFIKKNTKKEQNEPIEKIRR